MATAELDWSKLIEKYRDINVHYDDWYAGVYDVFAEEMLAMGIEINNTERMINSPRAYGKELDISFSGFWSQGDGAAYSGEIVDIQLFMKVNNLDYPMVSKLMENNAYYRISWGYTERGYRIRNLNIDLDTFESVLEDNHPLAEIWDEELNSQIDEFEEDVASCIQETFNDLYKKLYDEYDYLTSDDAVKEAILANDLHKDTEDDNED